jgi:hypothetical protein
LETKTRKVKSSENEKEDITWKYMSVEENRTWKVHEYGRG